MKDYCLDCGCINSFHVVQIEDPFMFDDLINVLECSQCEASEMSRRNIEEKEMFEDETP